MPSPRVNIGFIEALLVAAFGCLAALFAAWVVFWFALSVLAKLAFIFVVPGLIYVPVRLAVGGSALPPENESSESLAMRSIGPLLAALFVGYASVMCALFAVGCFVLPIGLLESALSVKIMPPWARATILPIGGAAFAMGVAYCAIQDVRRERHAKHQEAESGEP